MAIRSERNADPLEQSNKTFRDQSGEHQIRLSQNHTNDSATRLCSRIYNSESVGYTSYTH